MSIRVDTNTDRCAYAGAPTGDVCVMFWVRNSSYPTQYRALYWSGDSTAGGNAYDASCMIVHGNPASNIEVWLKNSSAARLGPVAPSGAFIANTWNHIALNYNTANGGAFELFIDGVSFGTGTAGSAAAFQTERTEFGNDANSDAKVEARFVGAKIWNRTLTQAEIRSEMWSILPVSADSIWACWSMFDDSGGLHDLSGNGRTLVETGTLTVEANDAPVTFEPHGFYTFSHNVSAGGASITGSGALTIGIPTSSGSGSVGHPGTGALAIGLPTVSGSGSLRVTGSGSLTIAIPDVDGSGTLIISGVGALVAPLPTVAGTSGSQNITGSGALVVAIPTTSGSGSRGSLGTGALLIGPVIAAGTGLRRSTGTGSLVAALAQVSGAGSIRVSGTGALTITIPRVNGSNLAGVSGAPAGLLASDGSMNVVLDSVGFGLVTSKGYMRVNTTEGTLGVLSRDGALRAEVRTSDAPITGAGVYNSSGGFRLSTSGYSGFGTQGRYAADGSLRVTINVAE